MGEQQDKMKKSMGLIRNFGWKKNLLAAVSSFLLCVLMDYVQGLTSNIRVLSHFDISVGIIPLLGFLLGIWGVIGAVAQNLVSDIMFLMAIPKDWWAFWIAQSVVLNELGVLILCALPSMLWYAFPMKGEQRAVYPRFDTAAHFIKYYVIMVGTITCYQVLWLLSLFASSSEVHYTLLDMCSSVARYVDIVLIIGIPLIIILSRIRNRTMTINERLLLAFLYIGVFAALLCAFLVYKSSGQLETALYQDYEDYLYNSALVTSDEALDAIQEYVNFWSWFYVYVTLMLNSLLILEMILMRSIENKVTRPILSLADTLDRYTNNDEGKLDSEAVKTQCRPYRYGYGEISSLTQTCVAMVGEIDTYTENLKDVTAEKERIGAELDVGSKIQRDMLPRIFPPFPERSEVELFADMTPAKEVGGDFYDFYFVDQNHLVLTIADVSGKGVPAALFMVISKTLLKNHAQTGSSPKEILTYVNHQLCQENESLMFCTVWLGVIDLRDGTMTVANAGHEYPALCRSGASYELLQKQHDPPLGVRDGYRFSEETLQLEPGDILFEYTDGVTEASNTDMELFGEERMLQVLNENADAPADEQVGRMYEAIRAFAGAEPQFDDITMLCFKYRGSAERTEKRYDKLTVPAAIDSMDRVTEFVDSHLEQTGCPEDVAYAISLSAEEIFVNIANYAYEGKEGDAEIRFSFDEETRTAVIVFSDGGIPFNPILRKDPDTTQRPADRPIGGLGIHIVKQTMDQVLYKYEGGRNILTIEKRYEEA